MAEVSPKELDHLLRQLDDDSYAVRLGAERRLDWLLGNPKLICPIMLRLKQRLADDSLDGEAKRRIEAVWQRARGAWLMSDTAGRELPAVSNRADRPLARRSGSARRRRRARRGRVRTVGPFGPRRLRAAAEAGDPSEVGAETERRRGRASSIRCSIGRSPNWWPSIGEGGTK